MAFANGGQIITSGIVLALDPADINSYTSGSTSWLDVSGNGNTGSFVNGPIFDSGSIKSIFFDGTNDYIDCGNRTSINITNNISCDMWFKLGSNYGVVGSNWGGLIGKRNAGAGVVMININLNVTSNIFQLSYNTTGTFRSLTVPLTTNFESGVWTHVAGTCAQSSTNTVMTLYKNGAFLATGTTAENIISGPANLLIGSDYQGFDYLNMNCGPVRVYNRTLSASEILQNYNAQKSRFGL